MSYLNLDRNILIELEKSERFRELLKLEENIDHFKTYFSLVLAIYGNNTENISVSAIQRHFVMGFNRAKRLKEMVEIYRSISNK